MREVLGEKHAETFVNKFDELATREDLKTVRDELKVDVADLRSDLAEFKQEVAEFKQEVTEFKREVKAGFHLVNQRFDALFLQIAAEGRRQSAVQAGSMVALTAIFTLILALMG